MDKINIIDNNGNSYNIDKPLGEGSQGKTFLLEGGNYIAKLFKKSVNSSELKSRINFLINLNLDKRTYSAPLQEIIAPKNGYISEFASGMIPLCGLKYSPTINDFENWYKSSGGLLKRYGVLIKLAYAIRSLHAKGLVYCDLSPNNVFVSENPQKHNVFLIDMDNLRYKTSIINNIFTPFYGAPEVVKRTAPNTVMSDCYSFAVIAYELLACNHPLIGDLVAEGDPVVEEQALRGELPWVENPNDDSNKRSTGLPSKFFITPNIMKLFHRTFEVGLNNAMGRPTMGEWVEVLNDGLNDLLMCDNCNIHYPYSNNLHCPFCGEKPDLLLTLKIQRWEKEEYYDNGSNSIESKFSLQSNVLDSITIDKKTSKYLKAFHLLLSKYDNFDTPIAQITIMPAEENGMAKLVIKPLNDSTIFFKIPHLNIEQFSKSEKKFKFNINSHNEMVIGFENFEKPQRVLVI